MGLSGLQEVKVIFVVISLPEAQKALPKECKQLHAVQLVKFEEFKSKVYVLSSFVALLSLESLEKMTHQNVPQKLWILQLQKPRRTKKLT